MSVGNQTTEAVVNETLTRLATSMRDLLNEVMRQQAYHNKLGLAGLEGLGFDAASAQQVLDDLDHMATIAGCYMGIATQASEFDFDDFLTHLWAGQ